VRLVFDSTSGTRGTITTTQEQPFWVSQTNGRKIALADTDESGWTHTQIYATRSGQVIHADHGWSFAADLEAGDRLATPRNTHAVSVTACAPLSRQIAMVYNLDVGGTHTYFVAPADAPDQCIWVHNAKPCGPNGGEIPKAHRDIVDERERRRAERRNARAREEAGQSPQGSKKEKGAARGSSGERPSDRRAREQNECDKRERNIGIDEEHSMRTKNNPGGGARR